MWSNDVKNCIRTGTGMGVIIVINVFPDSGFNACRNSDESVVGVFGSHTLSKDYYGFHNADEL
jgi:hypothetical protein